MNKENKTPIDLTKLLEQKDKNDHVVDYYKNNLLVNGKIYEAIQKRIQAGYVKTKTLVLGFIPITTKHLLDTLDIVRLELEMIEINHTVYNNKKLFEMWLNIQKTNDKALDEETRKASYSEENKVEYLRKV